MSDEAVRKAFEAWANKQKWAEDEPRETSRDDLGRYNYSDVQYGWVAWQAARSAAMSRMEEFLQKLAWAKEDIESWRNWMSH